MLYRVDSIAMDLLEKMLTLNPERRITTKEALEHPYLTHYPLPCAPDVLPKLSVDTHDYQLKVSRSNYHHSTHRQSRRSRVQQPEPARITQV